MNLDLGNDAAARGGTLVKKVIVAGRFLALARTLPSSFYGPAMKAHHRRPQRQNRRW
jgi:hypothetical protein